MSAKRMARLTDEQCEAGQHGLRAKWNMENARIFGFSGAGYFRKQFVYWTKLRNKLIARLRRSTYDNCKKEPL